MDWFPENLFNLKIGDKVKTIYHEKHGLCKIIKGEVTIHLTGYNISPNTMIKNKKGKIMPLLINSVSNKPTRIWEVCSNCHYPYGQHSLQCIGNCKTIKVKEISDRRA